MAGRALIAGMLAAWVPSVAQATVTCETASPQLAFGSFSPLDGAARFSNTDLALTCIWDGTGSASVSYEIALSPGNGGSFSPRRMSSGAHWLDYNLYTSATYSGGVWGDGTGGSLTVSEIWTLTESATPDTRDHTIYGRIEGGQQHARPGSYTDTIIITITY
jgi:spore coat protein U-like protein